MSRDSQRLAAAKAEIDRAVHRALDASRGRTRKALLRLIGHVRARSGLLRPSGPGGRIDARPSRRVVAGLVALADRRGWWLRPVEDWRPPAGNLLPQFADLARHLIARYPVPAFMTSAWLEGSTPAAGRHQDWYRRLALGHSLLASDLPIRYTRRMAHHFALAPAHSSVEQALRWGQVRGLGGSEALAEATAASRLGHDFGHDDFWRSVLRFFVNHPRLDPAHVGPIVDYLHDRPDLSMKGRTPASILRDVAAWRERLDREARQPSFRWAGSGIGGLHLVEGTTRRGGIRIWTLGELTSSAELLREGHAMHHCVATFARSCSRGETTIWSLRVEDSWGLHRVLTIQVNPKSRSIVQARRRRNAQPNPKDRAMMKLWARQEGLTIQC
jgi:hypothetical protein